MPDGAHRVVHPVRGRAAGGIDSFPNTQMARGIKVIIRGRCDVRIGAARITAPSARCTFANDELTIRGADGGSTVYSFSNGTNVCNFFNGGNASCSNGVEVQFNGDQLVVSGRVPRELVVCGVPVPLPESLRSTAADLPGVDFEIPPDHAVRSVTAGGTGRVVLDNDAAVDAGQFAVTASGTSGVDLGRNTFGVLAVTASGTGDIGGAATCKIASLVASGTGAIRGVHATESLTAVCSGVGNISVTASRNAAVSKTKAGIGNITVKTR